MAEPALDRALALCGPVLGAAPAGILADIDGTLAPIVGDPAEVRLAPGAPAALAALARRIALVGVVTGRSAADARRIVGPELLVAGNHGIEWLEPSAEEPELPAELASLAATLDRLLAAVPHEPGVVLEHKGVSATVHYRNTADPAVARARVLDALRAAPSPGLELREGRMAVELRPLGAGDKGTAVRRAVDRHRLRGLVVLGDDRTDLDMFRAAIELRAAGRHAAAVVGVGTGSEVPQEVVEAADVMLASPETVVELLTALAEG